MHVFCEKKAFYCLKKKKLNKKTDLSFSKSSLGHYKLRHALKFIYVKNFVPLSLQFFFIFYFLDFWLFLNLTREKRSYLTWFTLIADNWFWFVQLCNKPDELKFERPMSEFNWKSSVISRTRVSQINFNFFITQKLIQS